MFDGPASGIMNPIGYLGYFPILYLRYRSGIVTREQLEFMYVDSGDGIKHRMVRGAHRYIIAGGLADEAGQICSSVAQPYVSIVASTLLSQTSSVWTVMTSFLVLGARYIAQEFLGILIALAGASLEVIDIQSGGDSQFSMSLVYLASAAAPAISFVFKEKCFRLWHHNNTEKGGSLDVWVVASAAAVWSLAWAPFVTLATAYIKKPNHISLPQYLRDTFRCFSNHLDYDDYYLDDDSFDDDGDARKACTVAWQFWLLYMVTNLAYNISVYRVVRLASALTSFVCGKLVTPLTIALSLFPWPVIGAGSISPVQGLSLVVIFVGVTIFRLGTIANQRRFGANGDGACCWPLLPSRRHYIDDSFSGGSSFVRLASSPDDDDDRAELEVSSPLQPSP